MTINSVLMVVGLICLLMAAFGVPPSRVNLGWLGLAFWLLALLISPVAIR